MTPFSTGVRRIVGSLTADTLRMMTGIETACQRRAVRSLRAALADRAATAIVTADLIHTELRWYEPTGVRGMALIIRMEGRTNVDLWFTGLGAEPAEALLRAGEGRDNDLTINDGELVLVLGNHSVAEATELLSAYVRATTPTRVDVARAAHGSTQHELIAALEEELIRRATAYYPGAAWLVVDSARWSETWGESEVELRAVIDADGKVLHEHQDCQEGGRHPDGSRHTEWGCVVDRLLTELADLDGIGGWPEACRTTQWCELRAVPLTPEAATKDCRYPHDGHEEWDEV
ncbi:hypothetical protein K7472_20610 [Streptomyces sp. PTM05]|uniref:Uncharacterized protein n=1 Tax=Streptantibioticus parmotrematis TaxID=2873249 RepID=A0ABS7QVK1_9ACTN|nr:hypothetical protein [Streptantibioticus parmotrematis]MBY8887231.1 hypothetical protein [Streptantibioticus parmotrematis]